MKIVKNLLLLTLFTLVFNPTIAKEKVLSIGLLKYGSVNWEMDIIEPVSYTHLTLPTNREV